VRRAYIAVIFNRDKNKKLPRFISFLIDGKTYKFDLYREGSLKTIKQIKKETLKARECFLKLNDKNFEIVCQDFRDLITVLDLPIDYREYNVFDFHMARKDSDDCVRSDERYTEEIFEEMAKHKVNVYQKYLANSSIVYADLENSGLLYNYTHIQPIWSQRTHTGRSKSLEFNIQGLSTKDHVTTIYGSENDVLIHFDWICADIRVASMLSNDKALTSAFVDSDPYTKLASILNDASKQKELDQTFSRDECKLILLRCINSLDYNSIVFDKAYPDLGDWIMRLSARDSMSTVLGRKFIVTDEKNRLSSFNGVMQGSVAHAMHIAIRKIWEKMGSRIVCDIHDSIVVASPPDKAEINSTIRQVCDIMLRPFDGVLEEEYFFPVKVSIGKKWRAYRHFKDFYSV